MPDSAPLIDLVNRYHRRLYLFLRSLLPDPTQAEAALRETVLTIWNCRGDIRPDDLAARAEAIARDVALRHNPPFSGDLFRQLAASAGVTLDLADKRPAALAELLNQLPPPERDLLRRRYELGMTTEQMALGEYRPVAAVARDLVALHATLVAALRRELPDSGPEPPGGAADLGRLSDQLLDGTITDDGRLVLETLLLADAAAQTHYHRHVALAAELTLRYRGAPTLPEVPRDDERPRLSKREWVVTILFVVACLAAVVCVALYFAGRLR